MSTFRLPPSDARITTAFQRLLNEIEVYVPPGRERALVQTKLQEAAFFAHAGAALHAASIKKEEPSAG